MDASGVGVVGSGQASPQIETAGPGRAVLRVGGAGPNSKKPRADIKKPSCKKLCKEMAGPGFTVSTTEGEDRKPMRSVPKVNTRGPQRAQDRDGKVGPE